MWKDSSVWRNVFKKSFLDKNNLFFHSPELVYGEDALFMYEVKFAKPKTIEISEALYGYRDREGSASHSSSPEKTQRQLRSTIREAEIMRDYYESGREDSMTADRFMSFLYGALFHIAAMPQKTERERWLSYMRAAKLFPYRRPSACTISRSFQMNRGDLIEKIHDMIYIHLNTEIGFQAMYCWNVLFRIKKRLKSE